VSLREAVQANAAMAAPPTAVATVNVGKILTELSQSGSWQMQFNNLVNSIKAEGNKRQESLKEMRESADKLTDPTQRQQGLDAFALKQLQSEEWLKLRQVEVDRERSLMWKSLIRSAREESKNVAESEGYQLVLLDDTEAVIDADPKVNAPRETQVIQQISSIRVLYAAKTIDITEKVMVRIQNKTK